MTQKQKDIYSDFYQDLGDNQLLKVVEETSELNKEILQLFTKNKGHDTCPDELIEELGDAFNALESLIYVLNIDEQNLHRDRLKKLKMYHDKKYDRKVGE